MPPAVEGLVAKQVFDICAKYEKQAGSGHKWHRDGRLAVYKAVHCFVLALGALAQEHAEECRRGRTVQARDIHVALARIHNHEISAELREAIARAQEAATNQHKYLKPKKPLSAYFIFLMAMKEEGIAEKEGLSGFGELGKRVGQMWKEMAEDSEERKKYTDLAVKDKERYEREFAEWKKDPKAWAPGDVGGADAGGAGVAPKRAREDDAADPDGDADAAEDDPAEDGLDVASDDGSGADAAAAPGDFATVTGDTLDTDVTALVRRWDPEVAAGGEGADPAAGGAGRGDARMAPAPAGDDVSEQGSAGDAADDEASMGDM